MVKRVHDRYALPSPLLSVVNHYLGHYAYLLCLAVVFEMVSAFGGIGLTLGIPDQNFALSGAFSPVSKLVICVIVSLYV